MFHQQANVARLYFETSTLGPDTFQVVDFTGEENISQPFRFEITLVSKEPEIDFADVINQEATLTILRGEEKVPIHGVIADFQQGRQAAALYGYRAVLVPRLWLLTLNFQSRIFQNMTVEEAVTKVLEDAGLSGQDFRFAFKGNYPTWEYIVQYQENDLCFISRLLERDGIHFFFEHNGKDVLVMTDDGSENLPIPGEDTVTFNVGGLVPEAESVWAFLCREQVVTGKVVLKDYNYRTPDTTLKSESQLNSDMPGIHYEYGQHFKDQGEGDTLAQVRNEEIECQRRLLYGDGNCPALRTGHVFALENHFRSSLNAKYLLTRVWHVGVQGPSIPGLSGIKTDEPVGYRNEFTCIPADVPFRPPRLTPWPRISGIMSARIETAGGDYAFLDEEGRYHAKMYFDLSDVTGGEATRPIRMNQPYSGPNYGIHFPNHADTEMIWACVDGDPNRPLALGTIPNPSQGSPSTSANKPQNVIRTWGQNELTFDDASGAENIYLHATKDRNTIVNNDHTESVTNDQTMSVGNNRTRDVGNDETITIGNNQSITVGTDQTISVGSNQSITVGSNRSKSVGVDQSESIGANKTINVGSNHTETIGANMTQTVAIAKAETIGAAKALLIGAAYQVSVGAAMNETVGAAKMEEIGGLKSVNVAAASSENVGSNKSVDAGGNISHTAGKDIAGKAAKKITLTCGDDYSVTGGKKGLISITDELTIKCGSASIILKKNGDIQFKGKNIKIQGSGKIDIKASKNVVIKGKKILEN